MQRANQEWTIQRYKQQLGARHRTKTSKTKEMNNMDPTKNPGVNPSVREW